ncbi:protein of unknown function [Magnetospirillum sp. XM-1]|uniref:phospholipase D-like domain-containing protein n=1 Tax=Magnetospirillum sp. XM-1 TaxID=1663591 RepID=UPI00073DFC37|nr:phospholipase D family protein [Magnetospirillum sp. XM-1]CUW37467.1 protein of unknown function [Magnetospirillum sp. XM-1]
MTILTTEMLSGRLTELLSKCKSVEICVAWATMPKAARDIIEWARTKGGNKVLKAIIGVSGTATSAQALAEFASVGQLKLGHSASGCFHPKVYIFHHDKGATAWIGSANLTSGGFERNDEAVMEVSGDVSAITAYFRQKWKKLPLAAHSDIAAYRNRQRQERSRPNYRPTAEENEPSNRLELLSPNAKLSWAEYVDALKECNSLWSGQEWPHTIFSDTHNYLTAIHRISALLAGLGSQPWSSDDMREVFGVPLISVPSTIDARYVLGRMHRPYTRLHSQLTTSAGAALRKKIITDLAVIRQSTNVSTIPALAGAFIDDLRNQFKIVPALSSRLLTLTRPDVCVSSNTKSRKGLAHLFFPGKKVNLKDGSNYATLLTEIQTRDWWKGPRPPGTDLIEAQLWDARAALLDAFVYDW